MTDEDACRLKVGLRQVKGRWYVVVAIWDSSAAVGPAMDERIGPSKGLATEAEALVFYHEKVKPITDQLISDVEAGGVVTENLIKPPVLH